MKITRTREMTLDRLIYYTDSDEKYPVTYNSDGGRFKVIFDYTGMMTIKDDLSTSGRIDMPLGTTFKVETEEEITNETELEDVTVLAKKEGRIYPVYATPTSISECMAHIDNEILKIFANIDGEPKLVWSVEKENEKGYRRYTSEETEQFLNGWVKQ